MTITTSTFKIKLSLRNALFTRPRSRELWAMIKLSSATGKCAHKRKTEQNTNRLQDKSTRKRLGLLFFMDDSMLCRSLYEIVPENSPVGGQDEDLKGFKEQRMERRPHDHQLEPQSRLRWSQLETENDAPDDEGSNEEDDSSKEEVAEEDQAPMAETGRVSPHVGQRASLYLVERLGEMGLCRRPLWRRRVVRELGVAIMKGLAAGRAQRPTEPTSVPTTFARQTLVLVCDAGQRVSDADHLCAQGNRKVLFCFSREPKQSYQKRT